MKRFNLSFASFSSRVGLSAALASAVLVPASLMANVAYNESAVGSGDLSNTPNAPTSVSFGLGSNQVFGSTGNLGGTDRDFFTFTVPAGARLVAVEMLRGTTSAGNGSASFIGIISGNTFGATVPAGVAGAATLLGYHHYTPTEIGTDILDEIALGNASAPPIGFTPPLPAGTYSVWIQETAPGSSVNYGFDFKLVPDSGLGIWAGLGVVGLMVSGLRRSR